MSFDDLAILALALVMLVLTLGGLLFLSYSTQTRQFEECRAHGFTLVFCQQWQTR